MRQQHPKVRFSEFEFLPDKQQDTIPGVRANVNKVSAFIMLHGTSKWHELRAQFARQRTPLNLPVEQKSIATMSDAEYEKHRERILDSQQLPDKSKDVYGSVEAPDLRSLGYQAQQHYIETFGHKRYFEAVGADVSLDDKSYKQVVGYSTSGHSKSNVAPATSE